MKFSDQPKYVAAINLSMFLFSFTKGGVLDKREGLDSLTYGAVLPDCLWVVDFICFIMFFDQPKYVAAINLSMFLFSFTKGGGFR